METTIEWTGTRKGEVIFPGYTFNPWNGCQKVSAGCVRCYAETLMDHRYHKVKWGPTGTRLRTSASYWAQPLKKWEKRAQDLGVRLKVFCASLADVFEDRPELVPWRGDLFTLIHDTPHLDWLLLTKRIEGWEDRLHEVVRENHDGGDMLASAWLDGVAPTNVWLGTSIENQSTANERVPLLTQIPATIRFLSVEPQLEFIDLDGLAYESAGAGYNKLIDWLIVGGESGSNARAFDPDWALPLKCRCQSAGIAFFMKQMGSIWARDNTSSTRKGNDPAEWPEVLRVREWPGVLQ